MFPSTSRAALAQHRTAQPLPAHAGRWAAGTLSALAALALTACGGGNDAPAPLASKPLAEACAAYASTALPHGAQVTRTELRKAEGTLPDVCIVRGKIVSSPESTINWAVELPTLAQWNGKTLTIGGGGFDGFIPTDDPWYQQLVGPSANPYVKISGHQAPNFSWGNSDVALRNHAFDANHFVLEVGTAIATEFYGKRPTRRYHMGHSNGGRSGLISTQKYPKDYDGVVAMEPAISQQAHQVNLGPTVLRHIFKSRDNWMSPAKIALYAKAETAACDGLDGLKDGIIGNIEACNYVPTDLLCQGADSDSCLTAGQIESIRLIYSDHKTPVTLSRGAVGYPRFGRGGASTSDWKSYMFGSSFDTPDSFNHMAVTEAARLVEGNPNANILTHDPTQYQAKYLRLAEMIDATDPDISAFADNGGKLLIWYGLGDTCVSLYRTAEYFDSVKQRLGASKVQSFARMVTSPSNGHDLDGVGTEPRSIDLLAAMDAWVETGTAPDKLVATKFAPGTSTPVAQRPVCEFPKFPRYNGTGDVSKAESFTCSAT
jgi:feruloyl esterase